MACGGPLCFSSPSSMVSAIPSTRSTSAWLSCRQNNQYRQRTHEADCGLTFGCLSSDSRRRWCFGLSAGLGALGTKALYQESSYIAGEVTGRVKARVIHSWSLAFIGGQRGARLWWSTAYGSWGSLLPIGGRAAPAPNEMRSPHLSHRDVLDLPGGSHRSKPIIN